MIFWFVVMLVVGVILISMIGIFRALPYSSNTKRRRTMAGQQSRLRMNAFIESGGTSAQDHSSKSHSHHAHRHAGNVGVEQPAPHHTHHSGTWGAEQPAPHHDSFGGSHHGGGFDSGGGFHGGGHHG